MSTTYDTRIQCKRDTETNWRSNDPVLLDGEIVSVNSEKGTGLKIGDGTRSFSQLPYAAYSWILQTVYPVGSIYISLSPTNPQILFGFGTWEQIQDRFLLAAGSVEAGTDGGEETHSHTYGMQIAGTDGYLTGAGLSSVGVLENGSDSSAGLTETGETSSMKLNNYLSFSSVTKTLTHYQSTASTGTASTMPPYLAVYVWHRTV